MTTCDVRLERVTPHLDVRGSTSALCTLRRRDQQEIVGDLKAAAPRLLIVSVEGEENDIGGLLHCDQEVSDRAFIVRVDGR